MRVLGAIALLPAFALWCGTIAQRRIAEWDAELSRWCHRNAWAWRMVTRIGDGWLYALVFFGLRHVGRNAEASRLAGSIFVAWGICSALKILIRRERRAKHSPSRKPYDWKHYTGTRPRALIVWYSRRGTPIQLARQKLYSWSFPSQHAACAVAFAVALPNPATVTLAAGICASRVLIGAHYLGDVLAGVLVGLLAGLA